MPKETRSPKPEASVDRLARKEAPGTPRKSAKRSAAARDGWEAILRILDFGILSVFGFRYSDFTTPKPLDFHKKNCGVSRDLHCAAQMHCAKLTKISCEPLRSKTIVSWISGGCLSRLRCNFS